MAGTRAMSRSPFAILPTSSSALPVMVNSYTLEVSPLAALSIRDTSPMEVGPFKEPMRIPAWQVSCGSSPDSPAVSSLAESAGLPDSSAGEGPVSSDSAPLVVSWESGAGVSVCAALAEVSLTAAPCPDPPHPPSIRETPRNAVKSMEIELFIILQLLS